jgi:hypothetical protein
MIENLDLPLNTGKTVLKKFINRIQKLVKGTVDGDGFHG